MRERTEPEVDRRRFLRAGAVGALGGGVVLGRARAAGAVGSPRAPEPSGHTRAGPLPDHFHAPPLEVVRIGIVGVGGRGTAHVRNLLGVEGAEIRAVCDLLEERVERACGIVEAAGRPRPEGYHRGDHDFLRLADRADLDLVLTATPWRWHTPVCVAAMERGKHAASEVPAAVTLEECWRLVETAERLRRHCVMLENCCYGRSELLSFSMVRRGLLGDLVHAEAGYLHDLRRYKLAPRPGGNWYLTESQARNGNLYPTHGLGPVAQCLDVGRGDRFDHIVSMSSLTLGVPRVAREVLGPDHPVARGEYAQGDVNHSLIRTARGRTIVLGYDTDTPRPYSRVHLVQGTGGIYRGYPEERVYIDGRSPEHQWEPAEAYRGEYEHPLWKALEEKARGSGHGGMDYIVDYRLVQALRRGEPTDQDVYDAADWSAVAELSERSVARRSEPAFFPDFTRGRWRTRRPLGIVSA